MLVDHAALLRGETVAGEACEIEGLGPVPVAVVESWRHDAYLRLIVTDGIDVRALTRRSRYIDAHQDAALAVRDRHCVITGCDVDWRLERDHRVPYAQCHTTSLDGLGRMCWWHHLLKTKGWALVGGPGCYRLTPPGTGASDTVERSGRAPPRASGRFRSSLRCRRDWRWSIRPRPAWARISRASPCCAKNRRH